jgi:preprotein translocase subunit YajC
METEGQNLMQYLPSVIFLVGMMLLFWFVVIRPQKKAQSRHRDLIGALVPGDEVVTVGGVYGTVKRVRENSFELEVADGLVLTFDRRAVRKRQDEDD